MRARWAAVVVGVTVAASSLGPVGASLAETPSRSRSTAVPPKSDAALTRSPRATTVPPSSDPAPSGTAAGTSKASAAPPRPDAPPPGVALGIGSISGTVFLDADGDGRLDGGEEVLAAVRVKATKAGADGLFGTRDDVPQRPVVTDATGRYQVSLLPVGTYRVQVDPTTLPAGVVATTPHPAVVDLARGETLQGVHFGWTEDRPVVVDSGVIGGRLWLDADGDGTVDGGEEPVTSVAVRLTGPGADSAFGTTDDEQLATTSSDAGGVFRFEWLAPATYRVAVDPAAAPAGTRVSTPNPVDVVLPTATSQAAVGFGFQQLPGEIGDFVWLDGDADGSVDAGETGLGLVAVDLSAPGADGQYGTADDRVAGRTVTDGTGLYRFTSLAPGDYQARLDTTTLPAGSAPVGSPSRSTTVAPGESDLDVDFPVRWTGSIGDRTWLDANVNRNEDAGEQAVGGVRVGLLSAGPDGQLGTGDDSMVAEAVSSPSGDYRFDNLRPGLYRVTVDESSAPAGTALTTANPRDVTLAPDAQVSDVDFGFRWTGSVGDLVFLDHDGDGVHDAGEPGLDGARVTLASAGADGLVGTADDVAMGLRTTDASGAYSFADLAPGTYQVAVNLVSTGAAYLGTTPAALEAFPLGAGEQRTDVDAGYAAQEWLTLPFDTGAVTTVAGSGASSNVDGTGGTASFSSLSATVVVGGSAYVAAGPAIRRVDVATGEVSTVVGSPTASGCVSATTPTSVRLTGPSTMASDGYYLYVADRGCGLVLRMSLATGATSTVATVGAGGITFTGGALYVTATAGGIRRIDPVSGASSVFSAENANAITSDASALYVTQNSSCGVPCLQRIKRLPLDGSAATTLAQDTMSSGVLVSAGAHLFAAPYGNNAQHSVLRYSKSTGERRVVAGTSGAGYVDATGTDAWLSSIAGIATDGRSLWVADNGNRRLRRVDPGTALPAAQQSAATQTLSFDTGEVTTAAGSGVSANVDGTGTAASFSALSGTVVVGGSAYVASGSAIRRVDVATGQVSTLAGHASTAGCSNSPTSTAVRFTAPSAMTSDGYYLYVADRGCGTVRRVSIATGATSTVVTMSASGVTFAAGALYATNTAGGIYRIDPANSTSTRFSTENGNTITSDATALWVTQNSSCGVPCLQRIRRVPLDGSAVTTLAQGTMSGGVLVSAGDHLYAVPYGNGAQHSVLRFDKGDAAMVVVAGGTTAGYVDATGTAARFSSIGAVATDGQSLWVADHGNRRLRKVAAAAPLP